MLLHVLLLASASALPQQPADSAAVATDSLRTDTLHEVTVRAGRVLNVDSFQLHGDHNALKQPVPPPSFGDIVEKLVPGFNDKATHPFAIKQRRRERRHKRAMRALEELDRIKTFDDLLRESYERQMREDSISGHRQ